MPFIQNFPKLKNPFTSDQWLIWYFETIIKKYLTSNHDLFSELSSMGEEIVTLLEPQAEFAERYRPIHKPFSPWGERIDEIEVHPSWDLMKHYAAQWGLISEGYQRHHGTNSRLIQMIKLYLYHPSSAIFSCPLAMTDGCARIIEINQNPYLKKQVFPHLISQNPLDFWTSGQWMTETIGGSDVSKTETLALPTQDPQWFHLHGFKWFTSATTSEVTLALARIQGAPEGNKGLSLFFVPMKNEFQRLNKMKIERLKNKFGTWALPTAEITLEGSLALLISEPGQGVKSIAPLLNITRIYNTICSLGYISRALLWIDLYSPLRQAFGKALHEHPLHQNTFLQLHALKWGLNLLTFNLMSSWGRSEISHNPEDQLLLRFMIPLLKLYTGKKVVEVTSEVMEGFGGQGYIEDTPIPRLVANSHVMPIWEGTTNVLSLDFYRALTKEQGFNFWKEQVKKHPPQNHFLKETFEYIIHQFENIHVGDLRSFSFIFLEWNVLYEIEKHESLINSYSKGFQFPYRSFNGHDFYQFLISYWKRLLQQSRLSLFHEFHKN